MLRIVVERKKGFNRPFLQLSVQWPGLWMAARLQVTLFSSRPHCFFCVNQAVLMLTNWHLNEKSREIPSFAFTGQVTKHADSQIPSRARLYYLCISAAICAAFPLGNIVLTFHVPILVYLILERERWFRPVASRCLKLSPLDFILFLTEDPSSPK